MSKPLTMSAAKKVVALYLSSKPEDGGKYQYSLSILDSLTRLDSSRYDIVAIILHEAWQDLIPSDMRRISVRGKDSRVVTALKRRVMKTDVGVGLWRIVGKFFDPIQAVFHQLKPDLVLFPGNDPIAYETDIPFVIPIFDLMHRYEMRFPEVAEKSIYEAREFHYSQICRYASGILVDSELGKKHVCESYDVDARKIFVLSYVPPNYVRDNLSEIDVVTIHGLPERFLFYPAQFWKHKNHENLVKAVALAKDKGIIINVVFVGSEKNCREAVLALVREQSLDRQVFVFDFVPNQEVVAFYKRAVALVMPSFFGPTNIPPLEAFALGCPVVASNVYDTPAQVGGAALLFDPNDPHDIERQIEAVWTNAQLRASMIERGGNRMSLFSQESFGKKISQIIDVLTTN